MMNLNYVGMVVFICMAVWTFTLGKYVDTVCFLFYVGVLFWIDRERKFLDRLYEKTVELQKQVNDDIDNFRFEMYQDK